ncbi:MAG: KEOPS complex subunit Pcc1 [Candidatus Hodarchaeales archaeon]
MRIKFETRIEIPDQEISLDIYQVLLLEIGNIKGQRAREELILEGNDLIYSCEADDPVAAIASINSFYNRVAMIEKVHAVVNDN